MPSAKASRSSRERGSSVPRMFTATKLSGRSARIRAWLPSTRSARRRETPSAVS